MSISHHGKCVSRGKGAPKKRAEQPVSEGIRRAAKRAGIEATHDNTTVTIMVGDLPMAAEEVRGAFADVMEAGLSDDEAQHDVLVLRALRRLRNAQQMIEGEMGGAL